jgi:DNA topoisomerase VI subunit A
MQNGHSVMSHQLLYELAGQTEVPEENRPQYHFAQHKSHMTLKVLMANKSFKNVAQCRKFGTTITNENLIQKKIKSRWYSGNTCYPSVQNLQASHLLSKNVKNYT